jgi:hypothetical protein
MTALKAGGDYPSGSSGGRANGDRFMDGFWVPLVREMASRLGLFGLALIAFETLKTVSHVVLHVMGIGAAEHAASEECRKAGGGPTDLCAPPSLQFQHTLFLPPCANPPSLLSL